MENFDFDSKIGAIVMCIIAFIIWGLISYIVINI